MSDAPRPATGGHGDPRLPLADRAAPALVAAAAIRGSNRDVGSHDYP